MKEISGLVSELQSIARKNDDEFWFRIDIKPMRDRTLRFEFVCEETADGHTFVSGGGNTIADAVAGARDGISDACKQWGYDR